MTHKPFYYHNTFITFDPPPPACHFYGLLLEKHLNETNRCISAKIKGWDKFISKMTDSQFAVSFSLAHYFCLQSAAVLSMSCIKHVAFNSSKCVSFWENECNLTATRKQRNIILSVNSWNTKKETISRFASYDRNPHSCTVRLSFMFIEFAHHLWGWISSKNSCFFRF